MYQKNTWSNIFNSIQETTQDQTTLFTLQNIVLRETLMSRDEKVEPQSGLLVFLTAGHLRKEGEFVLGGFIWAVNLLQSERK